MKKRILSFVLVLSIIMCVTAYTPVLAGQENEILEKKQFCTGLIHSAAIKENGDLYVWGRNNYGQIGDGTQTDRHSPVLVMSDVKAVSTGYLHTLALKKDGTLWAWGSNEHGEIGNSTTVGYCVTKPIKLMENVIDMAAGKYQSFVVTSDNQLYALGGNGIGQLGDNTTTDRNVPTKILDDVVFVTAGTASAYYYKAAIKKDGSLWTWGSGLYHDDIAPMKPAKLTDDVKYVSADGFNILMIKNDDSLWAIGSNLSGELCTGNDDSVRTKPKKVMDAVKDVSTTSGHTFLVKTSGELLVCGESGNGQLGLGTSASGTILTPTKIMDNASAVNVGRERSFVCTDNGTLYGCGDGDWGALGDGTTTTRKNLVYIMDGLKTPPDGVDKYMIEQVSKYTSDDMMQLMDTILSSNYDDDVKMQVLNEIFQNHGLTDVNEGIKYLTETSAHRMNYRYLTTDEIYCAYNFGGWLTTTPKGKVARGLLWSSGLIFNFEKDEYLDILSLTQEEKETPGVKKYKKMLMDFMSADDTGIEVLENAKKTGDFFHKFIKLNNIEVDYTIENLMEQIVNCTSKNEKEILQEQFATLLLERAGVGKTLSFNSENFAKALGTATKILNFVSNTADDILSLINMEEQIEIYTKYDKFLQTIYTHPYVAKEMRIAAKQLYDDIENGYYKKIQSILNSCVDLTGVLDITKLKGSLNSANMIINFGAFLINNFLVDVGDFVRQASYTQGYAELSTLYSLKLKEDAAKFKLSKTAQNAWEFFEDYNILWSLRYKGEQQFLEMSSLESIMGKIEAFNYSEKEKIVNDTLDRLLKCKFEFIESEIPASVQYQSKSVINAPVNVYVYTQNGDIVAELIDGVESDVTNEYGRFAVIYRPYTNEFTKVICQNIDKKLIVKAEAVSDGLANFENATTDEERIYVFENVNISKGNIIETEDNYTYTIFNDKNDTVGTKYTSVPAPYKITFNSNSPSVDNIVRTYDSLIDVSDFPTMERPGYIFDGWYWDSACTNSASGTITIDKNLIFYAKWIPEFKFTVSNNEVTITELENYKVVNGSNVTDITIPETIDGYRVTKIGAYAFGACDNLTNIEIPEGVTEIGAYAFSYCRNLQSIKIPESVTKIGEGAFEECHSLLDIIIPKNITKIEESTFYCCYSLLNVKIPEGVTEIGEYAFCGCYDLPSIEIPESVTTIGAWAFGDCSSLRSVTIPSNVTKIEDYTFSNCGGLSIKIPKSLKIIEYTAFFETRLTTVLYEGTQEQWPEQWNNIGVVHPFPKATKYYNVKYYSDNMFITDDGETVTAYANQGVAGKTAVLAFYNEGKLNDIITGVWKGNRMELATTEENDEVKLMILQDLNTLVPICEAETVKFSEWKNQ